MKTLSLKFTSHIHDIFYFAYSESVEIGWNWIFKNANYLKINKMKNLHKLKIAYIFYNTHYQQNINTFFFFFTAHWHNWYGKHLKVIALHKA